MEQLGVINYLTYLIGCLMIILLPGPNSLFVLSLSAHQGIKMGWAAAIGVFTGDAILMIATGLGAASLLSFYPVLFVGIKTIGSLYLGYIGLKLLQGAFQRLQQADALETPQSRHLKQATPYKAYNKALIVSLLNPKAILFFLSFFLQFVDPAYKHPLIPLTILGVTLQIFSLLYLASLIYAGSRLADSFRKHKRLSALSGGAAGLGFVGFAVKLAFASIV